MPLCQQVDRPASSCETRLGFQEPLRYLLKADCMLFRRLQSPWLDCGDYGEQMFSLSCLLTHKSWQRLGPRLHTRCLSSCIPVCVGPVRCCFTLREITDVSKNSVFTAATSLLLSQNQAFCGEVTLDWKRHEVREEVANVEKTPTPLTITSVTAELNNTTLSAKTERLCNSISINYSRLFELTSQV